MPCTSICVHRPSGRYSTAEVEFQSSLAHFAGVFWSCQSSRRTEATEEVRFAINRGEAVAQKQGSAWTDVAINGGHVGISGTLREGTGNSSSVSGEYSSVVLPKHLQSCGTSWNEPISSREVTKATRSRLAQGGPSWTALRPYLESSGLDAIIERQRSAAHRMRSVDAGESNRVRPGALEAVRDRIR